MAATKYPSAMRVEYHVIHTGEPDGRWEIQYGKEKLAYDNWDKDSAVTMATQMARSNPPSTVIVHDRGGAVERSEAFDQAQKSTL